MKRVLCGAAAAFVAAVHVMADQTVQVNIKALLNARPVITLTGGVIVPYTDGVDNGTGSGEATMAAALHLGNSNVNALPDDGTFAADSFHPYVALSFSNTDGTGKQVYKSETTADISFDVPAGSYRALWIFCMSSSVSNLTVTLSYQDGTTDTRNVAVPDWYTTTRLHDNSMQCYLASNLAKWGLNTLMLESANHYLSGFNLTPDTSKTTVHVRIQKGSSGTWDLWGVTGVVISTTGTVVVPEKDAENIRLSPTGRVETALYGLSGRLVRSLDGRVFNSYAAVRQINGKVIGSGKVFDSEVSQMR